MGYNCVYMHALPVTSLISDANYFQVIESFSTLHLVMEFAGEGDLQARVLKDGPLPENQARHIFAQVASAINHMVSM